MNAVNSDKLLPDPIRLRIRLDAARGIAAITVLVVHIIQGFLFRFFGLEHWLAHLLGFIARHAVIIFFILSGYLICRSIIANIGRTGRFDSIEFFIARLARLYPPYLAALLISVLVYFILANFGLPGSANNPFAQPGYGIYLPSIVTLNTNEFLFALSMTGNALNANPPLWSFFFEVRLYVLAGLFAIAFSQGPRGLILACIPAGLMIWWCRENLEFLGLLLVWLMGAAVAFWEVYAARFLKKLPLVFILITASLFTVVVLQYGITGMYDFYPRYPQIWGRYALEAALAGIYLVILFSPKSILPLRVIEIPASWAPWSYSCYVVHCPFIFLLVSLLQPYTQTSLMLCTLGLLINIVVAIAAAKIVAHYLERPATFKRWLRRVV